MPKRSQYIFGFEKIMLITQINNLKLQLKVSFSCLVLFKYDDWLKGKLSYIQSAIKIKLILNSN